MIELQRFTRKTFSVEAIQVTNENIQDVAKWCGGVVKPLNEMLYDNEWLIDFPTTKGINGKPRRAHAVCGDWISRLAGGGKFRHYKDADFRMCFLTDEEISEERYAKVYQKLAKLLKIQETAVLYDDKYGLDVMHDKVTRDILDIFR